MYLARIEEVVKKTKKEIDQEIIEVGKRTVIDLGINGLGFKQGSIITTCYINLCCKISNIISVTKLISI